ncbi:MAG: hypothetical protein ABIU09_04220 [Pyrinomonadaceae bacterium]
MQNFTSVPFKTESGLSSINGMAKFSPAGIVLEFEPKLFGLISDGVKEVRLALPDILDVTFRKGFLKRGAKIEIRATTFTKLAELPNKDGKLTLKLVPADFERAKNAVEKLQRDISETAASLPPVQTPVSQLFEDETEEETRQLK